MSANGIASDGDWAGQCRGVVERPDIRANANTNVEQFIALDFVVSNGHAGVATVVFIIDKIDGTKS